MQVIRGKLDWLLVWLIAWATIVGGFAAWGGNELVVVLAASVALVAALALWALRAEMPSERRTRLVLTWLVAVLLGVGLFLRAYLVATTSSM